jgi:hypothetical protein
VNPPGPSDLLPGDHCLYFDRASVVDWLIAARTWGQAAHIEIYVGQGGSIASRNGIGVNRYPFRADGLVVVLRPRLPFDFNAGMAWFETVSGQKYDFTGLLSFYLMGHVGSNDRKFCSELTCLWDRAAGIPSFAYDWPAEKVAPDSNLLSPAFETVWTSLKL